MTTPTCLSCGAKFSHDKRKLCCSKCGLPDSIRDAGMQAIRIWQKGKLPHVPQPLLEGLADRKFGARNSRKAHKHGRPRSRGKRVYRG